MFKIFKSVLACGLAAAMLISMSMALPVFANTDEAVIDNISVNINKSPLREPPVSEESAEANEADSDIEGQMKLALEVAKTNIEIDEEIYTEFSFDVYDANGKTNWNFNWSSVDYNSYIYITVIDDKVTSYSRYIYSPNGTGFSFAKLTKSEAEAKAFEFLKKIEGDNADKFKVYSSSIYYNSDSYSIEFREYKDGYLNYAGDTPAVAVDKLTGEITSYYNYYYRYSSDYSSDRKFVFQNSSKIISLEQAAKAYVEKIGLELVYSHYYDYSTKKSTVFPVYRTIRSNASSSKYINAVTGEITDTSDSENDYKIGVDDVAGLRTQSDTGGLGAAMNEGMADASSVSYTSAELSELEKVKAVITKEEAIKIAMKTLGLSADDIKDYTKSANLSKDYINQSQYLWNINFYPDDYSKYYNISIDARNGNVISYNRSSRAIPVGYSDSKESEKPEYKYTYAAAKKIALAELNRLFAYSLEDIEFVEETIPSEKQEYYNFTWNRKANGYLFDSNYISISIDNTTGEITSYYCTWYEDIIFPEVGDKIISQSEAFAKILEYTEYTPAYIETKYNEEKNTVSLSLIYMLKNHDIMIDPITGEYLNYSGEPDMSDLEPDYEDVKGHWSEEVVTTLYDNGIYIWGGNFDPEKAITTAEFIEYIQFYSNINYNLYDNLQKVISSYLYISGNNSEKSAEKADATLTKQESAKIICELLGYDKLMKKPEYLLYPFDVDGGKVDEEYKGYLTVCYMLGVIEGDGKLKYNAYETLTRAEAAQMLYNLLTK